MRAALGASRGRIARALLSESVALALAVGVAIAHAATGLLRAIAPAELPRVDEIGIDVTVLVFTLAVSVLSGALFGVFAVVRFGSPSIMALKKGGRPASDAPGRHRTRSALVVEQVALALTLLIVSRLMIRTFVAMRQVDPGFTRPEEVQTFALAIPVGNRGAARERGDRCCAVAAARLALVEPEPGQLDRLLVRVPSKRHHLGEAGQGETITASATTPSYLAMLTSSSVYPRIVSPYLPNHSGSARVSGGGRETPAPMGEVPRARKQVGS